MIDILLFYVLFLIGWVVLGKDGLLLKMKEKGFGGSGDWMVIDGSKDVIGFWLGDEDVVDSWWEVKEVCKGDGVEI